MSYISNTVCAILAGGEGRRLGGVDKAIIKLDGRRMVEHLVDVVRPQCLDLAVCLQSPKEWAAQTGFKVLLDRPGAGHGPLGGVCAALHWANQHPDKPRWVVTVPVDLPFLPNTLIGQLTHTDSDIVVAQSGERNHHTVAAWRPHLVKALDLALSDGPMPVHSFQAQHAVSHVTWPIKPRDPFLNINTPDDLDHAESVITETIADNG